MEAEIKLGPVGHRKSLVFTQKDKKSRVGLSRGVIQSNFSFIVIQTDAMSETDCRGKGRSRWTSYEAIAMI